MGIMERFFEQTTSLRREVGNIVHLDASGRFILREEDKKIRINQRDCELGGKLVKCALMKNEDADSIVYLGNFHDCVFQLHKGDSIKGKISQCVFPVYLGGVDFRPRRLNYEGIAEDFYSLENSSINIFSKIPEGIEACRSYDTALKRFKIEFAITTAFLSMGNEKIKFLIVSYHEEGEENLKLLSYLQDSLGSKEKENRFKLKRKIVFIPCDNYRFSNIVEDNDYTNRMFPAYYFPAGRNWEYPLEAIQKEHNELFDNAYKLRGKGIINFFDTKYEIDKQGLTFNIMRPLGVKYWEMHPLIQKQFRSSSN